MEKIPPFLEVLFLPKRLLPISSRAAGPADPALSRPPHHRRRPGQNPQLARLRRAVAAGAQPLRPHARRPTLAGSAGDAARPRPAVPLPQPGLPAPDLRRAPGRGGAAPRRGGPSGWATCSGTSASRSAARPARAWRRGWPCPPAPTRCCGWRAAPSAAPAAARRPPRVLGGRRLGLAPRPPLRDRPRRPRAEPGGRPAARPAGRDAWRRG